MGNEWWKARPCVRAAWFGRRRPNFFCYEGDFPNWALLGAEEGNFEFELVDSPARATPRPQAGTAGFGDIVICPPNTVLRRRVKRPLTHHVLFFDLLDDGGTPIEEADTELCGKITVRNLARLSSNYSSLQKLEGRQDAFSLHLKEHVLTDLLLLESLRGPGAVPEPMVDDGLIASAEHYLREHLHEPIRLQSLAESLGLNPVRFGRRFRAALRCTPIEYLTSLRLERARTLLIETDFTLEEIARRCGYNSGLYLSRVFLKEMKIRPGRFRALQRM